AQNSFLMKQSPKVNRTMFIAAGTAYAGFTGGLASIVAGLPIRFSKGWYREFLGTQVINYHVLFAVSTVLRLTAAVLALRVRETASLGTRHVLAEVVSGTARRIRIRVARPRAMAIGRRNGWVQSLSASGTRTASKAKNS